MFRQILKYIQDNKLHRANVSTEMGLNGNLIAAYFCTSNKPSPQTFKKMLAWYEKVRK